MIRSFSAWANPGAMVPPYRLSTTSLGMIASYDLGPAVISSLTDWQDRKAVYCAAAI